MQDQQSRRTAMMAAMVALAGFHGVPAAAQEAFPSKPINLVIPYGPGTSVDIVARMYAQRLSSLLGQPVLVSNKPGAGTMIGTSAVAHAPSDGHTLLIGSNALSIMPHLYKPDFDPLSAFVPVAPMYNTAIVLVAKPTFPANTLGELAALARKQPRRLSYSTWGVGGSAHMIGELYKDKAGISMLHVPYKGGGSESAAAVVAGEVDVGFDTSFTALPRIRSGVLKALGVFSLERVQGMPDVETAAEAGYGDAALSGWIGVFAPARTPRPVVQKLTMASQEAMRDPVLVQRLLDLGSTPFTGSPLVLMDTMRAESERVQRIVIKNKIEVE